MTQTLFNEELDLFDRPSSPAFPLPDANYAYEQFGGGRRYEEPTVELTPSRRFYSMKGGPTNADSADSQGPMQPGAAPLQGPAQPGPSTASLDQPQDDVASDVTSLTVPQGSSRHPSPFTGDMASRPPGPASLSSRHPSPFTGDMFYGSMGDQPTWTGQQTPMDQAPDPSAFMHSFLGQVPPFDLHCGSHSAPQAGPALPPSTNIIPPTPLKDMNDPSVPTAHTPSPGPSQQLDMSHYSPDSNNHERFPEESLTSCSEELPVVGRRSAETNAALDAGFAAINQNLLELSRSTAMPMNQVINLFMKSRGCTASSINYWNLYSNYFKDNSKQELTRLHQDLPVGARTPSATVRKDCYTKFKDQYPNTFQDILNMHDEISSLGGVPQTVSRCAQAFQRLQKRVTNILDVASTKFGFESATVMCDKIVNQDASLGHVHTTPGATDFFVT
ncbi:hypothetical protein DFJ58DRAFT_731632 [Suillus subalutaceus]|uniref:uncharacterized protein n=1 Tax=Suillus subalutaceus TaxID=48586 RepID=UPI001B867394|nr:uncharacterized protein DFJ58DRAFT_731632 [Suillus subalutaceus]KAG1843343.1 hypothetical protein DFJ58DRAFT_731632 [Suillus subalutaceus]